MSDDYNLLDAFGLVGREKLSKLDEILRKLELWMSDLEGIKDRLKDKIDSSDDLDNRDVKLLISLINQLNRSIELYGKYTGDLKNQNINMNINMDYRDALMGILGILNESLVSVPSVRRKILEKAKEKGILFVRKPE